MPIFPSFIRPNAKILANRGKTRKKNFFRSPVAVGGIGGSGTRVIAEILKEAGLYLGHDLNEENDNLWFTLLFKRREILSCSEEEFDALLRIFFTAMTGGVSSMDKEQLNLIQALGNEERPQQSLDWLRRRAETLLLHTKSIAHAGRWGWKEPNSHIVLERLKERISNMKYIHVARNGLDMAHSENQNQLALWGRAFLGQEVQINPYYSLKFWCAVHRKVIRIGESMKGHFFFLNFDEFCMNPGKVINDLLKFIGEEWNASIPTLKAMVRPPESMGRFRRYGTDLFSEEDVRYVKSLGFDVR